MGQVYDISWEDYIKVNTSNSRQVVNIDCRHFRSKTDAFHNSLFVSFPRIVFEQFASMCVHLSLIVFIFLLCQLGFRRPFI